MVVEFPSTTCQWSVLPKVRATVGFRSKDQVDQEPGLGIRFWPDPGFRWICLPGEQIFLFRPHTACLSGRPGYWKPLFSCVCLDILIHSLLGCWTTDATAHSIPVSRSNRKTNHGEAEQEGGSGCGLHFWCIFLHQKCKFDWQFGHHALSKHEEELVPVQPHFFSFFQTLLLAKQPLSKMYTQMLPSAMSQAATLSTSSWALDWHGQWPPSTGLPRDRSSTCQQALSPSL